MRPRRLWQLRPDHQREIESSLDQMPHELRDPLVREWLRTGTPPAIASEHKRPYHDRPRSS